MVRHLWSAVLLTIGSSYAAAQDTTHSAVSRTVALPGDRIRVHIADDAAAPEPGGKPFRDARGVLVTPNPKLIIGTLVHYDARQLRMRAPTWGAREPVSMSVSTIARLERAQPQRSYTLPGAFVGVVGGFLAGYLGSSGCPSNTQDFCLDFRATYGLIGAGLGGVAGAVIGSSVRSADKWQDVPLPR